MKEKNRQTFTSDKVRLDNTSSKNAGQGAVVSEGLFEIETPAGRNELLSKCIELGLPVEETDDDVILKLIYEAAKDKFIYYKKTGSL
ncbi:MAG: hypothetical protein ACM339_13580 [Ignavibacteria bacterium]